MSAIENAITWALQVASDDAHSGYDQINRWGPSYDCSSLLISAWQVGAGVPVKDNGATYTGNMRAAFQKCGFSVLFYRSGMTLVRGDILLNERHHTAMYIGDNKVVQASSNEKGGIYGGQPGDQTKREIAVFTFYEFSKGWDYVLRYKESEVVKVNIEMPVLSFGAKCAEVGLIQTLLNSFGYVGKNKKKLSVDSEWGANVDFAFEAFQKDLKKSGVINTVDKICGQKSWNALLHHQF